MVMTRRQLLKRIDSAKIEEAIRSAERQTSGEICVSVAPFFWGDVTKAAKKAFNRLGVSRTAAGNGVLFFVVPSRHKFVVLGDTGIHEKVGDIFWKKVVDAVSERFRVGDFTDGLVKGIEQVGEQLSAHFPYDSESDVNELPDNVSFE